MGGPNRPGAVPFIGYPHEAEVEAVGSGSRDTSALTPEVLSGYPLGHSGALGRTRKIRTFPTDRIHLVGAAIPHLTPDPGIPVEVGLSGSLSTCGPFVTHEGQEQFKVLTPGP